MSINNQPIYFHGAMSQNKKTGPMLVTTTSSNTCPPSCAHLKRGTCYAKLSFLGIHWRKVDSGKVGKGFGHLLDMVRGLPSDRVWRLNQAGDLPGIGEDIQSEALAAIVEANKGKRGFTYTHKYNLTENVGTIRQACRDGFTINLSADNIKQAKLLHTTKIPVVVTVSEHATHDTFVEDGITFVSCPAETKNVQCIDCKMCAIPDRKTIIVFHSHGARRKSWDV